MLGCINCVEQSGWYACYVFYVDYIWKCGEYTKCHKSVLKPLSRKRYCNVQYFAIFKYILNALSAVSEHFLGTLCIYLWVGSISSIWSGLFSRSQPMCHIYWCVLMCLSILYCLDSREKIFWFWAVQHGSDG